MKDWKELLKVAYKASLLSPDPSTQNGAILCDDDGVVTSLNGECNRFPNGVHYLPERWEKPLKYKVIEHAERNVILMHAREGVKTRGLTMVCPWAACSDCARSIIQAGIKRLVTHKQAADRSPPFWAAEIEVAFTMLREAGVEIVMYDGEIGCDFDVRHSGQVWRP